MRRFKKPEPASKRPFKKGSPRPNRQAPAPRIERLGELLHKSGISLNKEQLDQLWRYHNLIRKRNQDRELTRIIEFESMIHKHYVDSMIVGKYLTLPSPILDVGTGAGFPGIPLKIRYPHLRLTLAEPRPNLIEFLKEARKELDLKNVEIFEHKVVSRSFKRPVKAVICRAVEVMEKMILRTSACVEQGGQMIFLKGPSVDPELKTALRRFSKEYRLVQDDHYFLPHTSHERRLIVLERLVPPAASGSDEISEASDEPSQP